MMIQAVLSNPSHPEYGVATIPFPIPRDQYAHCMEMLEALEIGDALKADCKVEKIDSFYSVLKRTEMLTVNMEELNYLAKRLESFDTGEAAQFQAMAHKLELFELKDLINLTFCCQQATVITDFSDLAAIGRDHYMNLHGGSASVDELNALDVKETARRLIESGSGTITPYGVVYDNGMKLEQIYDGRFFPCYYYEPNAITVAATAKSEPEDTEHITWLYLIKHRGIARDVVAHFAKAGLLYEDAEYHNAVFVGTDTDGVPHHAHKRSANSYGRAVNSPMKWMFFWIWSMKLSPTSTNWQRQRMGYQTRTWKSWVPWSCWQSQSLRHRSKTLRKALTSLTSLPVRIRRRTTANT